MIPIQNFYTGTNANAFDPSSYFKTVSDNMKDYYNKKFIANRELLKSIQDSREKMAGFTSYSPVPLMSESLRLKQAAELERFKEVAAQEAKGIPSMSKRMELQNLQKSLVAQQQNWLATDKLYNQAYNHYINNRDQYEPKAWNEAELKFQETGEFDPKTALKLRPQAFVDKLLKIPDQILKPISEQVPTGKQIIRADGTPVDVYKTVKRRQINTVDETGQPITREATVDDLKDLLRAYIPNADPEMTFNIQSNFNKLIEENPQKAQEYFDKAEKEESNALIEYAIDTVSPFLSTTTETSTTVRSPQRKGNSFYLSNGSWTNGEDWAVKRRGDGFEFNEKYIPSQLSLDKNKLVFEKGVMSEDVNSFVDGKPIKGNNESVQFVIDNNQAKYSRIKKYDVDDNNKPILYTSEEFRKKYGSPTVASNNAEKEGSLYKHYVYPEKITAIGDTDQWVETLDNYYEKGVSAFWDKSKIVDRGKKPTIYLESDFDTKMNDKIKLFMNKNKMSDYDRAVRELIDLGILPKWEGK